MRIEVEKAPPLYFKGCGDCVQCCEGKFFLAPLVLEDFEKVKEHFEIRAIRLEEVVPVMLLTDGEHSCKYLKNGKCSIYDSRPPACKIYPFSPYFDKLLIDLECEAVGNIGEKLPTNYNEFTNSPFFEERFNNFVKKREKTIEYMKTKELFYDRTIQGIDLYSFEL